LAAQALESRKGCHEVANLITRDEESKIVVLSALSGTTIHWWKSATRWPRAIGMLQKANQAH
jgi:hypothetical protein